jgi:hypothetical protein
MYNFYVIVFEKGEETRLQLNVKRRHMWPSRVKIIFLEFKWKFPIHNYKGICPVVPDMKIKQTQLSQISVIGTQNYPQRRDVALFWDNPYVCIYTYIKK